MCTKAPICVHSSRYKLDKTVKQYDLFANIFWYESSLLQGQHCAKCEKIPFIAAVWSGLDWFYVSWILELIS